MVVVVELERGGGAEGTEGANWVGRGGEGWRGVDVWQGVTRHELQGGDWERGKGLRGRGRGKATPTFLPWVKDEKMKIENVKRRGERVIGGLRVGEGCGWVCMEPDQFKSEWQGLHSPSACLIDRMKQRRDKLLSDQHTNLTQARARTHISIQECT